MKSAAELEDGTEKSAVTPGPLAPARELLGEMLLEMKEPTQALEQFEATLTKEPGRFRALYGAAHAAQLSGSPEASQRYFGELLKVCERADKPGRADLLEGQRAPENHSVPEKEPMQCSLAKLATQQGKPAL